MILPLTEVDSIRYIHKANKSHERPFESIIDKVYREDKERKEKAENERKKKEAILHKRELEKRKAEEAKRAKEIERHDAENRARQELEQRTITEEVPSSNNDRSRGKGESIPTSGVIGSTWAEVSPEQASQYMASKTGVPASRWKAIIYHESTNNPTVTNSIGCFGYLQLHPVHGAVSQMTPQQYLDTAVGVYQSQGLSAWEVVTMGKA